jgi:Protein of unknown function (DUF3396)
MTTDFPPGLAADTSAFAALDEIEVFYPDSFTPALRICCRAVLFFEEGGTLEKRLQAFRILADYAEIYRDHLSHVQHAAVRPKIEEFRPGSFVADGERAINLLRPDQPCEAGLFGPPFQRSSGGISHFGASLVARQTDPLFTTDISYIEFSVSAASLLHSGFDPWISFILSACNQIKPLHGLAGPSIQFDRIYSTTAAYVYSLPYIKRFPGLHCGRDASFTVCVQGHPNTKIFSTNWLTALSDQAARPIGGIEGLKQQLGDTGPIHKYEGGLLVQAGATPQIGDVNRGLVPEDYRRVARALKPIRFEDYSVGLLDVESPLDSLEETLKWIRRCD